MRSTFRALVVSALAAMLEGWAAGGGVKARFAQLRLPLFPPPRRRIDQDWRRLLHHVPSHPAAAIRDSASKFYRSARARTPWCPDGRQRRLGGFFFRRRNLRSSFQAFPPYVLLTLALGAVL